MKTVTISEAKATLSALVDAAEQGEQILIMRGSKPAVTLTPVSEADMAFWPSIPAAALTEFDREIEADRKNGGLKRVGRNAAAAAKALKR